jgi:hypothetical protein
MLAALVAAAFAFVGGSSYLLSHIQEAAPAARPKPKLSQPKPTSAKVLGAATTAPSSADTSSNTPPPTTSELPSTSTPAIAEPTNPPKPASGSQLCALTCIPGFAAPTPSFDLIIDRDSATKSLLGLTIPFHVVRHAGLATPIHIDSVSLQAGGKPSGLLRVQVARMTDSDHGVITIINLGLPLGSIVSGNVNAESNGLTASASFSL